MADKKNKAQFGIDASLVNQFDWQLARGRIATDIRSDFIYAPHFATVFSNTSEELFDVVRSELQKGQFSPGQPVTIEVPKSTNMRVSRSERSGPSFSRPGSILHPKDRLVYQILADVAAPIVDAKTDKARCFSQQLVSPPSPEMFLPNRTCWNEMQKALATHREGSKYILKADIANCFASINLHTLVNFLRDSRYPTPLLNALENILTKFTGERSSRGIIQGVFPSDLLGNFYLTPIDQSFADSEVQSVRYVDDIYVFMQTLSESEPILRRLTSELRNYDLVLNEAKSFIIPASALMSEEPDLEDLFQDAVQEIRDQLDDSDFREEYGFQAEWEGEEDDEENEEELTLKATEKLFGSMSEFPLHQEKIERYCLPIFARSKSPIAVTHVLESFEKYPAMAQIYSSYLANFVGDAMVVKRLAAIVASENVFFDWQKMWIFAGLLRCDSATDALVKYALGLVRGAGVHEALKAVAAIFVGKFGSFTRRKSLMSEYGGTGSPYVQSAILYASRYFPANDRRNAITNWSGHSQLHQLVADAISARS